MTLLSYGQRSSLLQNINIRAKELKHELNRTGDSLILHSEKVIEKVEIYNSEFEKKFPIFNNNARIPIANIPSGRYVTEVKLPGKLILITLLLEDNIKPKPYKVISKIKNKSPEETHDLFGNSKKKKATRKKVEKLIKSPLAKSTTTKKIVLDNKMSQTRKRNYGKVRFYWIVSDINKGQSSSKLMRIGEKAEVEKMIEQNRIDRKSKAGKNNKLTIWEVYDTSKFMRFIRLNPNYANAQKADCFNVVPIYKSRS